MRSPDTSTLVEIEKRGAIALVGYANPPHGYITTRGATQLLQQLSALLEDHETRAIVLYSRQAGVFILHADVSQILRGAEALQANSIDCASFVTSPFAQLGQLGGARKPVITAIDGTCMGGGFEIALACTLRAASRRTPAIGLPEIRLDLFPRAGGTQPMARLIGRHKARALILQGALYDACEAYALGLVDELVDDNNALDKAIEIAARFVNRSPAAINAIMELTAPDPGTEKLEDELLSFARLLRDTPSTLLRLRQFLAEEHTLDELP